jgi:DNA-binding IclR family transcriptional regulator/sugar lactone lactonase YvrE
MAAERAPGEGTASLEKAIDVLEAIADSGEGMGHLELAEKVGLPKTTVYRILSTLVARGLVRRDPLRRVYCLGARTIELARRAYSMPELVAAARGELRMLRDVTGETTYLAALDGMETVSLERCEGTHNVRSATRLGVRKPLHCTSQGKAMLSALPDETRNAIVAELELKALTRKTITDRRKLKTELKATAERGYAIDEEEIVMGVRCVGAPIVDRRGMVRGALSIAGPIFRMTRERVEQLGPEVAEAARRVGEQLGSADTPSVEEPSSAIEGAAAIHGAMPRWSVKDDALVWADTVGREVRRFHQGSEDRFAKTRSAVTGVALQEEGVLVAFEDGWQVFDVKGRAKPRSGWPGKQLCALGVHPGGELWVAMRHDEGCHVGTLGPAGDVLQKWSIGERVDSLAWAPDGRSLYGVAPESGSILLMQPGAKAVRRLATMPKGSGRPGGLALDAEGGLWTALLDGWSVVRFEPDGTLSRVMAVPVPRPTDVAFGGDGLRSLYVTSARDALPAEILAAAPLSGRVFELDAGVAGVPLPLAG